MDKCKHEEFQPKKQTRQVKLYAFLDDSGNLVYISRIHTAEAMKENYGWTRVLSEDKTVTVE